MHAITPAHRFNDGANFTPTNRYVLWGHHFAAISGPGPLIGPVLAAQFGFLPGLIWLVIGVVIGGAVHDFIVLVASIRHDGKSLAEIARREIDRVTGTVATIAILIILIVALAGVGLAVVNALAESPWGLFTIAMTIPIALLMGLYMFRWRGGSHRAITEATIVGVLLLVLRGCLWQGRSGFRRLVTTLSLIATGSRCLSPSMVSSPRFCRSGCCWHRVTTSVHI
jgi:carbon starvation protein